MTEPTSREELPLADLIERSSSVFVTGLAESPDALAPLSSDSCRLIAAALRACVAQTPPRQPTEAMLNAARDWSVAKYGRGVGNDGAIGCWQAMFDASPVTSTIPLAAGTGPASTGAPSPERSTHPTEGSTDPAPIDFADAYTSARKQISDQVAAEVASRNSFDEKLHRPDLETDAEFVRRIIATYLALAATDQREGGK